MRLTIGMPSYDNYDEVWFTVQSLRMHHDLSSAEILIVDNFGCPKLRKFVDKCGGSVVRYVRHSDAIGVSAAKNRIFEEARGDVVFVIDSHILLKAGALDVSVGDDEMVQGPLLRSASNGYLCEWLPQWRARMWGIWAEPRESLPEVRYEIWAQGAGCFACRRSSWVGFNPHFRAFGGETGYIQEKWRKAGGRVVCDPAMVWSHYFNGGLHGRQITYPMTAVDRVRNYLLGFEELGLDTADIYKHFGRDACDEAKKLYGGKGFSDEK